jgi:hypothetical protein
MSDRKIAAVSGAYLPDFASIYYDDARLQAQRPFCFLSKYGNDYLQALDLRSVAMLQPIS